MYECRGEEVCLLLCLGLPHTLGGWGRVGYRRLGYAIFDMVWYGMEICSTWMPLSVLLLPVWQSCSLLAITQSRDSWQTGGEERRGRESGGEEEMWPPAPPPWQGRASPAGFPWIHRKGPGSTPAGDR